MAGNSRSGGYRRTSSYHYLEQLPARLREAIAGAAYTWDAKWFFDHWQDGKSVDWCIDKIKEWDRHEAMKPHKHRNGFKWESTPSAFSVRDSRVAILYTAPALRKRKSG
jgi:hypothetical protein